jgi:hypothetical protein
MLVTALTPPLHLQLVSLRAVEEFHAHRGLCDAVFKASFPACKDADVDLCVTYIARVLKHGALNVGSCRVPLTFSHVQHWVAGS